MNLQLNCIPAVNYLSSLGYGAKTIAEELNVSQDTVRRSKKRFGNFAEPLDPYFARGRVINVFNDLVTSNIETTGDIKDGIIIANNVFDGYCLDEYESVTWLDAYYSSLVDNCAGDLICNSIVCGFVIDLSSKLSNLASFEIDVDSLVKSAEKLFESTYGANAPRVPLFMSTKLDVATKKQAKSKFIATDKTITITSGIKSVTIDFSHPKFEEAVNVLHSTRDADRVIELVDLEKSVRDYFEHNNIKVTGGEVFYKDRVMHSSLTKRIIASIDNNEQFMKYILFMENLMLNPSNKAVTRLFDFLEANDIEITEDGQFIAWKKVGSGFMDLYTGTMSNAPGAILTMDRNLVNENDDITCSHGLHVCSKSYLSQYGVSGSNKVVRVLVHPRDVVSIPTDYDNAKMRTCGYYVIDEVK